MKHNDQLVESYIKQYQLYLETLTKSKQLKNTFMRVIIFGILYSSVIYPTISLINSLD